MADTYKTFGPLGPDVVRFNWVDVTGTFFDNIKSLSMGQLLHDDLFGLFEAMSAIEMMDPKMDAGMLCNRRPTVDDRLEYNDIEPDMIISVIDTTYACFVSWLDGHSLAQTVFTNRYLSNPYLINDRTLKSFCIAIYKLIDIVKDFVNRGLVFEEEDFQPMVYGYKLNPDMSEIKCINLLKEVEEDLRKKKSDALLIRIKFTRILLQSLFGLNKKDIQVLECTRGLSICSDMIEQLVSTSVNLNYGFDPLVNQRLLPPTFPRYTHIKTIEESYKRLDELFVRLKQATKICSVTSFHAGFELMLEVSCSKPCIVSRSVMQLLFLPNCSRAGDTINCIDAVKDSCRVFVNLTNLRNKEYVECFFGHCVKPFSNLIQLCGHNRARQRDKLAHLLEDFANLQDEAERIDSIMKESRSCFATWILYYTLKIMIMFLLSGFELELYSTHEYYYIYWYLFEFLYNWSVSSLSRSETGDDKKAKKKGKEKKKNRPYQREITLGQALQNMCGGYYKAMVAFRKDGKLKLPHDEFDIEKVRYEHRFAPFINVLLTPPPVQYTEFKDMTSRLDAIEASALYMSGYKHFHQARTCLESIQSNDQEIKDLIKVAKTNFVVLKLLASGSVNDQKPPDFDFSLHQHFPIIKIR